MAVAYDNSPTAKSAYNVTSITSNSFTIGSNSNRAALVSLGINSNNITSDTFTGSCGGASLATLSQVYENYWFQILLGCVNPSSGTQTASVSWQNASVSTIFIQVLTFDGVDQSTPFDSVQQSSTDYDANPLTVSITSISGDLTASFADCGTPITTNQSEVSNASDMHCADIGPGTGSTTHTWTKDSGSHRGIIHGVNVNQVSAGGAVEVTPDAVSLEIDPKAANVNAALNIAAGTEALEVTAYQAGINAETSISAASASCEISSFAAAVSLGVSVSASRAELEIDPKAANVNAALNIAAGSEALEVTAYQASLNQATDVSAVSVALEISSHAATVGLHLNIPVASAAYTLTAHGAELSIDINVQALCYEALVTANDPTVTVGTLNTIPASPYTLAIPVRERIAGKSSNHRLVQRVR